MKNGGEDISKLYATIKNNTDKLDIKMIKSE